MKKAIYRLIHHIIAFVVARMNFPVPEVTSGAGAVKKLPGIVKSKGINNVLVVTDKVLAGLGLLEEMLQALGKNEISYTIYDGVQPNPTIANIEDGLMLYTANHCRGIIAFGGGSPMDCAKVIGARSVKPKKSVSKMRGLNKVRKEIPPFFAVPTTAGTGSETTVAAVISDPDTHEKYAINDPHLVPDVAILDPELMLGLPPQITSTTGMDALTHAVEAYIGLAGTDFTNENAEKATRLIFDNLESVYEDGSDLEKRENMALASFYAGSAFTRALVGYVHAIAHNMGGLYGVPHGLANAVILPYVLELSREDAEEKLAALAIAGGMGKEGESRKELSIGFIEKIKEMNRNMDIPTTIKELQEKDIPLIAQRALKEANPTYPVPTILNQKECEALVRKLLP